MHKTHQTTHIKLTALLLMALASTSTAEAQPTLLMYGNIDVALDHVRKGSGNLAGNTYLSSVVPSLAATSAAQRGGSFTDTYQLVEGKLRNAYATPSSQRRVTPSIASQNALGVRGSEDLGSGYNASFVLEGQFNSDTGAQGGQDSRMWGRQAYVGLSTPLGEVRLGRQYTPMFYTFAASTVEALGASDLMGFGMVVNSLQNRLDNAVSYWLKNGGFTASVAYSPNGGVASRVSSLRAPVAVVDSPNGQILGGASAGHEASNQGRRGETAGVFINYAVKDGLNISMAWHANKFGDAQVVDALTAMKLVGLDRYQSVALGAKYVTIDSGTVWAMNLFNGKFSNDASSNQNSIQINVVSAGVKHPIRQLAVGAELAYGQFTNFTKGKDMAVMFSGDYSLSKRTKLYTRLGWLRDIGGKAAALDTNTYPAPIGAITPMVTGGPVPILTGFGSTEVPFFAGGGVNIDATARVFAVGVRHQF